MDLWLQVRASRTCLMSTIKPKDIMIHFESNSQKEDKMVELNKTLFYFLSGTSFLGVFMLVMLYLVVNGTVVIG